MLIATMLYAAMVIDGVAETVPPFVAPAQSEAALAAQMTDAARALTAVLPPEAIAAASFTFAGPEHRFWHWVPAPLLSDTVLGRRFAPYGRYGVPLEKMSDEAIASLHRLLRVSLSARGYGRVEQVLRREGGDEPRLGFQGIGRSPTTRPPGGPGWYFFTIFGTVGVSPWAWRFEGHHLSLTYEVVDGQVRCSPLVVGHNPSPVPPDASTLAVRLFQSLTPEQQQTAQVVTAAKDPHIPGDMDRSPAPPQPVGALLGALTPDGLWAYEQLVEEFIGTYPEALVHDLRQRLLAQAPAVRLAWYGAFDDAHPHFYRLHGPSFLIQVRHQGLDHGLPHVHTSFRRLDDGSVASTPAP